jgi:hypothetical protein
LTFFESKSFPINKQQGEFIFTKFKIDLNQFGVFFSRLQKKIRKEKAKRKGKRGKGRGKRFGPKPEPAHGPKTELPNRYYPSLLSS